MGYFVRHDKYVSKTVLRYSHVVVQLPFSMSSPILTFDFDLIFRSFFYFLGP